MRRIKEPLELMGARVELLGRKGCAPIRVTGGGLRGIEYKLPVASAQVKSCVLLAGMFAQGTTAVTEPKRTRDHTERILRAMGIPLAIKGLTAVVEGSGGAPVNLKSMKCVVPGDFSSASVWLTAAACKEGSDVVVERVGLNPRRTAFLRVLRRMGAEVTVAEQGGSDERALSNADGETLSEREWEPVGSIRVRGGGLCSTEVAGDEIPSLIDELPLVAVAGALAAGKTVIRDAAELRVKESDRISAVCSGLSRLGVRIREKPDGMIIEGPARIRGGVDVESRWDHRIAMALAVAGLVAEKPVRILDSSCVGTSYPDFWGELERLTG